MAVIVIARLDRDGLKLRANLGFLHIFFMRKFGFFFFFGLGLARHHTNICHFPTKAHSKTQTRKEGSLFTLAMEVPFISLLKAQPTWVLLLSSLGFLSLLQTSITLLKWAYAAFLRPGKDLKAYGSWALVTGATDGIGKAIAFQLAHEGLNLVLLGRNPKKLRQVSDEIKAKHRCTEIKPVVIDLAGNLSDGIRRLEEEIEGLEVGILVNNAGMTYPQFMYFDEVEEELWEGIVKVNLEATTRVTRAVLPGMMKRGRGAVVCIGSASSVVVPSFPLAAVYAATKA